ISPRTGRGLPRRRASAAARHALSRLLRRRRRSDHHHRTPAPIRPRQEASRPFPGPRRSADRFATWERRLGVSVRRFSVQRMKTKWGSCNPQPASLRFNTELAKKPTSCLEYILVHEMLHLIVRRHDAKFRALLDRHLPDWKHTRQLLNSEPLAHEEWLY